MLFVNMFSTTLSMSYLSAYTGGTSAVTKLFTICSFFFIFVHAFILMRYGCSIDGYRNPIQETDAKGNTASYSYDKLYGLLTVTNHPGQRPATATT